MSILQFACPQCAGQFQTDSAFAGQTVACPHCGTGVMLPPLDASAPPPDAPAPPHFGSEPMSLACPFCGGGFLLPPELAGQQVACPHCQQAVTAPAFEPQISAAPPLPLPPPSSEAPPPPAPASSMFPPGWQPPSQPAPPSFSPSAPEVNLYPPGMGPSSAEPAPAFQPPAPTKPAPSKPAASKPAPSKPAATKPAAPASSSQPKPQRPTAPQPTDLLPPGSSETPASAPLKQVALPEKEMAERMRELKRPPPPERGPGDAVLIPTEEGSYVALHEPVKTVGSGVTERELRVLSPEEKQQRRLIRNIVMYTFALLILIATFILLTRL